MGGDPADELIHIGIAAEKIGVFDGQAVAVRLGSLCRPDLLVTRFSIQGVVDGWAFGKLIVPLHPVVRRRTEEGEVGFVKGYHQKIVLLPVLF